MNLPRRVGVLLACAALASGCGTLWLDEPASRSPASVEQPPVRPPARPPGVAPLAEGASGSRTVFAGPRLTLLASPTHLQIQREVAHAEDWFRAHRVLQDQLYQEVLQLVPALRVREELAAHGQLESGAPMHPVSMNSSGDRAVVLEGDGALTLAVIEGEDGGYRVVHRPSGERDATPRRPVVSVGRGVHLERMAAEGSLLALWEREAGVPQLRLVDLATGSAHRVEFPEEVYALSCLRGAEPSAGRYRFLYESPTTPPVLCDYAVAQRRLVLDVPVALAPAGAAAEVLTRRVHATARDGARVPITLLLPRTAARALVLRTEPDYGTRAELGYSPIDLVLIAHGLAVAVVHGSGSSIHPGAEVTDAATSLIRQGVAAASGVLAWGRGAGALPMALAVIENPQRFAAVILEDPMELHSTEEAPHTQAVTFRATRDAIDRASGVALPPLVISATSSHLVATQGLPVELLGRWRASSQPQLPQTPTAQHHAAQHHATQNHTTQHHAAQHHAAQHHAVQHQAMVSVCADAPFAVRSPQPTWDTCRLLVFLLQHVDESPVR